jgi:hypothetical protein
VQRVSTRKNFVAKTKYQTKAIRADREAEEKRRPGPGVRIEPAIQRLQGATFPANKAG